MFWLNRLVFTQIILLIWAESKIQSATNLFPFRSRVKVWDLSEEHMIALVVVSPTNNTLALQMYNFATKYVSTLGWRATVPPIAIISTNTNTNISYTIGLLSNSTYMSLTTFNSIYPNGTSYSFSSPTTTHFITNNFTECYVSTAAPVIAGVSTSVLPSINWFRASTNPFNYTFPSLTTNVVKQLHFNNSNFFFTFDAATSNGSVFVFSTLFAGQPTFFNQFQFLNCTGITGDVYQTLLLVGCGNKIYILNNYAPYAQVNVLNLSIEIDQVVGMENNSLLVKSSVSGLLAQYNILDGSLMDIKVYSMLNSSMRRVNQNQVYLFNSSQGILYNITTTIVCQGVCNCSVGYIQQGAQCIAQPPNSSSFSSPSNITQNQSLSSSNSSLRQTVRAGSIAIGNILALTSIRVSLKSNVPLSLFMEQFWLYKYYRGIQYPQIMNIFMREVQLVNVLKIKPSFIDSFQIKTSLASSQYYNQLLLNYTEKNQAITYNTLYYLQATKQFFIFTISLNIIIFIVFKIIALILKDISRSSACPLKVLYEGMKVRSQWWALFMMVVESNYFLLCYNSLNQISLSSLYAFQNKLVVTLANFVFWILISYGIYAYILLYNSYKKSIFTILVFTKPQKQSILLESLLILVLKIVKSVAHSNLFAFLPIKFSILVFADLASLICIIFWRKQFMNMLHFIIYGLYQFGVFIIDLFLFIKSQKSTENLDNIGNAIQYILLGLLGLTLAKVILSLWKSLYQVHQSCIKNKVIPRGPLPTILKEIKPVEEFFDKNQQKGKKLMEPQLVYSEQQISKNYRKNFLKPKHPKMVVRVKTILKQSRDYPVKSVFSQLKGEI